MTNSGRHESYTSDEIDGMLARGEDLTDWERIKTMTEEELEASIDVEEEGEFDWTTARVTMEPPTSSSQGMVRLDRDIIIWFQQQGPHYQTRMNQVLRAFVEAQREKEAKDRQAS